jgi:hypothetical protein
VRCSFEEEFDRHLKCFGDLLQAACANSIRALFIFLYLLECQAERFAELRLGPSKHHAAHAHSTSHMFVSWMRSVLWHRVLVSPLARVGGYTIGSEARKGRSVAG